MGESPSRQIVAFMAFAVAFGVIGHQTNHPSGTSSSSPITPGASGDVKIFLGGAIGTVLLVLLAQAGDGAASFAKGLAAVTLVSSILINGNTVFGAVSHLTGTKTSTPAKVSVP